LLQWNEVQEECRLGGVSKYCLDKACILSVDLVILDALFTSGRTRFSFQDGTVQPPTTYYHNQERFVSWTLILYI